MATWGAVVRQWGSKAIGHRWMSQIPTALLPYCLTALAAALLYRLRWRGIENGLRLGAVPGDLLLARLDRGELCVGAHVVHELDRDLAAIEIAVETEQEHLQHRRPIVEGGAGAEIGRSAIGLAIDMHAGRVDAVGQGC